MLGLASATTGSTDTGFVREPAGTLSSMTRSGKSYYYLTDATGNFLGAVDQAGTRTYDYTPTGTARTTPTETVPQPYRFASAYSDPTGLYETGARYYDPTLGRFTQPDLSGQETNTYLYAAGDPINRSDPSGLENSPLEYVNFALGAVGAVAGVVGLVAASPVVVGVAAGVGAAAGIALVVEGAACLFAEAC